ncbi:hypothetical protein D6D01_02657 [Aureobasidium pullulans]|uniref:Uncharacterized protein n=1 Tax=Aureobasidium pullulans TaxID=5580 RepID=A0A4S9LS73_AURPU|nr:hypothetical protein D6D01_02657 [Aureobasidium pullulans]
MAPSLYNTINAAFKRLYRRFQRLEQRVARIEEYLEFENQNDHHDTSSSSSKDDEDVIRPENSASQRASQSETEVPDKGKGKEKESRAKAKKLDDITFESGIDGEVNIFARPRGRVRKPLKTTPAAVEPNRPSELNGSRSRPAPTAHRAPNDDDDDDNEDETTLLLAPVNDHQEEPSRAPITRSAARSLGIEVPPISLIDHDNPSPYSKAKRGNPSRETGKSNQKRNRSNEYAYSAVKPAWLSQKRDNGRFSK